MSNAQMASSDIDNPCDICSNVKCKWLHQMASSDIDNPCDICSNVKCTNGFI